MKVAKAFFDSKQSKSYAVGDDYKGDREKELQDLGYLEKSKPGPKANKAKKGKVENK